MQLFYLPFFSPEQFPVIKTKPSKVSPAEKVKKILELEARMNALNSGYRKNDQFHVCNRVQSV